MGSAIAVEALNLIVKKGKILDNLAFQVFEGEFFIITGPSGAGKTMLISVLAGLQGYSSGSVEVCGQPVGSGNKGNKLQLGMVSREAGFFEVFTVKENLTAIGMLAGLSSKTLKDRVAWGVEAFCLEEFFNRRLESLPEGVRQRLSLACALLSEPKLLLLDDLLLKGDCLSTRLIMKNIFAYLLKGNTCLWTTGSVREASLLAEGESGLGKLLLEQGGLRGLSPEDKGVIEDYCLPGRIGCLDEGKLTIHSSEKFQKISRGF
jgi:ABC-2 type transport system ATP-binding protein